MNTAASVRLQIEYDFLKCWQLFFLFIPFDPNHWSKVARVIEVVARVLLG